jgi:hypothetical protein
MICRLDFICHTGRHGEEVVLSQTPTAKQDTGLFNKTTNREKRRLKAG